MDFEKEIYLNRLEILTLRNLLFVQMAEKGASAKELEKMWDESYKLARQTLTKKYPTLKDLDLENPELNPVTIIKKHGHTRKQTS